MVTNPITGRAFIFTGYPPGAEEFTSPDLRLTIAIIIFCIVEPFWLIGKFAKHVSGKIFIQTNQENQRTRKLA